jgi:oxygen-dependent protoporphyrinogen oxidase
VARRFEKDLLTLYPELHGRVRELVIQRWPRGLPYASVGRARLQEPLMRPLDPIFLAGDYLGTWYSETATWTGKAAADGARELLATEPSKVPA